MEYWVIGALVLFIAAILAYGGGLVGGEYRARSRGWLAAAATRMGSETAAPVPLVGAMQNRIRHLHQEVAVIEIRMQREFGLR